MGRLRAGLIRFGSLFRKRRREREMAEELQSHLQMNIEDNLRSGMTPGEARRQALIKLGGLEQVKEECRDSWGVRFINELAQDVRYGLRQLRRNPGFTIVAILTLALGIGGTTAIFNVVYGVLLHPVPWKDNNRLVAVVTHDPKHPQSYDWAMVTPAEFLDFQKQNRVFDQVMGSDDTAALVMTGPKMAPALFVGKSVTPNTFRVLGMRPILGRTFTASDGKPGAPPVVVLSYRMWQRDFSGNRGVLGQTIFLNHQPTTVIGVMPPRFAGVNGSGILSGWEGPSGWLPVVFSRSVPKDPDHLWWLYGHLKPGVTVAQASSDISFLAKRFAAAYPKQHPKGITFSGESFTECERNPESRMTLGMLMGGVGLLLLIACVNVANLLLARASTREHEMAIRAAIGAGRVRLVRQLLIESLLLACGGALLGSLVAWNLFRALVSVLPDQYVYSDAQVRASAMNVWVLLFAVGITVASTLLFGLAPAVLAVKKDFQAPLKGSGRGTGETRGHNRLRNVLVVSEVVLSLVLLTGAGLLFRSFWALRHLKLGYNINNVLQVGVPFPRDRYKTVEQKKQFQLEALRRLRNLPGVASAALDWPMIRNAESVPIEIPGQAGADTHGVWARFVGDEFFATLDIPLLQGHAFTEEEVDLAQPVILVNRAFVDRYFSGVNPLGRRIKVRKTEWYPEINGKSFEIVGVVGDTVQDAGSGPEVRPQIFFPSTMSGMYGTVVLIRPKGHLAGLANPVRKAFSAVDKEMPVFVHPVRIIFHQWYIEPDFVMGILTGFGLLGLVLVCIGV